MKRLGKITALFTAIAIVFTGCKGNTDGSAPLSDSEGTSRQISEPVATEESEKRETAAPTTEETAESIEAAQTEESDSDKWEPITYSKPDEGHVFVDFEYIENAEGITDPEKAGEWLDRALEALWETENYKTFEEYVQSEDFDREKFADYVDENGNPAPRFEHAFIEDFDGNNTEEAFVVVTMPVILPYFDYWKVRYFLIYTGDSNTKLFERLPQIFGYDILDYGVCKQLVVYTGGLGVETGSTIYGVSGDVPDVLYSFRGSYQKVDCFLSAAWGWQGSGDFMYYDTAAKEYRAIMGRDMSFDDWFAMDTSGSIDEEKRNELVSNPLSDSKVIVIGGKYYCVYYG